MLYVFITAFVVIAEVALLMFIWRRRDQLRRLFQGSGGVVGGGSTMSGGVDPHHPSGCDHTGDGGSGHC